MPIGMRTCNRVPALEHPNAAFRYLTELNQN